MVSWSPETLFTAPNAVAKFAGREPPLPFPGRDPPGESGRVLGRLGRCPPRKPPNRLPARAAGKHPLDDGLLIATVDAWMPCVVLPVPLTLAQAPTAMSDVVDTFVS